MFADDLSRRPQDDQSILHVENSRATGVGRNAEFMGMAITWIDANGSVKCKIKAQTWAHTETQTRRDDDLTIPRLNT